MKFSYRIFVTLRPTGASLWTDWTWWCCYSSSPHCSPAWQRVCDVDGNIDLNTPWLSSPVILPQLDSLHAAIRGRTEDGALRADLLMTHQADQIIPILASKLGKLTPGRGNNNTLCLLTTTWVYLCLTLSMRAAARLLVLSPSCRLHVGQCSTRLLQDLQIMWPAADCHQMWLVTTDTDLRGSWG